MPLQTIRTTGLSGRLRFELIPQLNVERDRRSSLMDALRTLAHMAEDNPKIVEDVAWAKASEGIATLIKRGAL